MNYFNTKINRKVLEFKNEIQNLKIIERDIPLNSAIFFEDLCESLPTIKGLVDYSNAENNILQLFEDKVSIKIKKNPFFNLWIKDMSKLCQLFSKLLEENTVFFCIGTKRGCKRYHVDMVPFRLLVTYAGQGTELLPNHAADREAFFKGKSNKFIVKDKSKIKHIKNWDIALFRGGKKGILHRTPDSALENRTSILMKIDSSSFLEQMI